MSARVGHGGNQQPFICQAIPTKPTDKAWIMCCEMLNQALISIQWYLRLVWCFAVPREVHWISSFRENQDSLQYCYRTKIDKTLPGHFLEKLCHNGKFYISSIRHFAQTSVSSWLRNSYFVKQYFEELSEIRLIEVARSIKYKCNGAL